jgi:hypothetical protein
MAYTSPSITTSGTTFAGLQQAGAAGLLENLVTSNLAASAAPTAAPTLSTTGTGNTLPTGNYYVTITESDGCGETTQSPTSSVQAVTLGAALVVTFPTLKSGNVSRNVYVGTSSSGPFTLVATGVTAATYNVGAPLPTNSYAVNPPTLNSTGIVSDGSPDKMRMIRSVKVGNLQDDWNRLRQITGDFVAGRPVNFQQFIQKLRNVHTAVAMMSQACAEIGTLVDANPGTIKYTTTPVGLPAQVRTQP